jgi:hypothetical protein
MQSKQAPSSLPLVLCSREKLGPEATIDKENEERKEKSQKTPEKCDFFWRHVEIAAENAVLRASPSPKEAFEPPQGRIASRPYEWLAKLETAQSVARSA